MRLSIYTNLRQTTYAEISAGKMALFLKQKSYAILLLTRNLRTHQHIQIIEGGKWLCFAKKDLGAFPSPFGKKRKTELFRTITIKLKKIVLALVDYRIKGIIMMEIESKFIIL